MTLIQLASVGAGVAQYQNGAVAPGQAGTIFLHDTVTPVTLWTDETGGTVLSSSGNFTTDALGRIPGWATLGLEVDITVPPASTVTCFLQGAAGTPGTNGSNGAPGVPGISANWRGAWSVVTGYALGDGVSQNGLPFVSNQNSNTGNLPTTGTAWTRIAGYPDGWFNVKTFGAAGDGVTDDSSAIQAAIAAAHTAGGGTVYFPNGTYVASGLSLDLINGVELLGAGPAGQANTGASKLLFNGTSGNLLTLNSSVNCILRNLTFEYSSSSFTGDLINMDGATHAADCQNNFFISCSSKYTPGNAGNARSTLRLSRAVINTIWGCQFVGATNQIRIGDPAGQYVIALQIEKCEFNESTDAHILIGSNDCESLVVRDCTFEAGINTTAIRGTTVANDGGQNECYSPTIEYCWYGDASGATNWIKDVTTQSNAYAGLILGNRFATADGGTHLTLGGTWNVISNTFEGATSTGYDSSSPSHLRLITIGNFYNNLGSLFNLTNFPSNQAPSYTSIGNLNDPNGDTMGLGGQLAVSGAGSISDVGSAGVLVGHNGAAGYVPLPTSKSAAIYRGEVLSTTRPALVIQAPWGGSNGDGLLLAGATPQPMFQWQDGLLGFNGVVPVAIPHTVGTTTGYTTGSSTAVTIDGKSTGNVGMAAPQNFTTTAVATSGTFASGVYFWKVTALNAAGETVGSTERSATIVTNGSATLVWSRVAGATSYKVYRATTTGGEGTSPALVTTIGSGATITYTDTGTAVGAGAVPASSTAVTGYTIGDIVQALKNQGLLTG